MKIKKKLKDEIISQEYEKNNEIIYQVDENELNNEIISQVDEDKINIINCIPNVQIKAKNLIYTRIEDYINSNEVFNYISINTNHNLINTVLHLLLKKIKICFPIEIPKEIIKFVERNNLYNYCYLFQTEQLTDIERHRDRILGEYLKYINVIDYSNSNVNFIKKYNFKFNFKWWPYQVNYKEINNYDKIYDVCFVNTGSSRRYEMIRKFWDNKNNPKQNFKFHITHDVLNKYGKERDELLFRYKITINVHNLDDYKIFEELRCSRCIFNKVIVITEDCLDIKDHPLYEHMIVTDYDNIYEKTLEVFDNYEYYYNKLFKNFDIKKIEKKLKDIYLNNQFTNNVLNVPRNLIYKTNKERYVDKKYFLNSDKNIYHYQNTFNGKECLIICGSAMCNHLDMNIIENYDFVIGINDIYKKYKCNLNVFKAGPDNYDDLYKKENPLYTLRSDFCNNDLFNEDNLILNVNGKILDQLDFDIKDYIDNHEIFQSRTSFTSGLHIAAILGFKTIDIIGCDPHKLYNNKYYFKGYSDKYDKCKYLNWSCLHKSVCPNINLQRDKLIDQLEKHYNCKFNLINPNIPKYLIKDQLIGSREINTFLHLNYDLYKDKYNIEKLKIYNENTINYYIDYNLVKIDNEIGEKIIDYYLKEINIEINNNVVKFERVNTLGSTSLYYLSEDKQLFLKKPILDKKISGDNGYIGDYDIIEREVHVIKLLNEKKFSWCPKLIYSDDELLVLNHCGENINKNNLPVDYLNQLNKIYHDMKSINLKHNDWTINEIIVKDDKLFVVDYGWATINDDFSCGINISKKHKPCGVKTFEKLLEDIQKL